MREDEGTMSHEGTKLHKRMMHVGRMLHERAILRKGMMLRQRMVLRKGICKGMIHVYSILTSMFANCSCIPEHLTILLGS